MYLKGYLKNGKMISTCTTTYTYVDEETITFVRMSDFGKIKMDQENNNVFYV